MKFKNTVSIFLSLAILICTITPAFAEKKTYEPDCPYIFIHGFMGSTIYVDPDDPDSEAAWPPSTGSIVKTVFKALPALMMFMFTKNYEKLGNKITPLVSELFEPVILGPNGEPKDKSGVRFEYPPSDMINSKSQLNFVYDWRLDPIYTAGLLNDFINYVLDCSGCNQVVIECHSYGGVVTATYAKIYGTEKVRAFAFNSTAVFGETYTGELFKGQLVLNAESLTSYLKGAVDYSDSEKFLNVLFNTLYKTGITGKLCDFGNDIVDGIGIQAMSDILLPMFGGWLSIWSMIPDEMFEDAYAFVFENVWSNQKDKRAGLIEKITDYNTKIRPYKIDTLRNINNNSNFYVIARHGYSAMFMTPSWKNASDSIVDVKYGSFGATTSEYNSKLDDNYLADKNSEYISPDKVIDASTCLFPEQTWFIKHLSHSRDCDELRNFIKTLLYSNGQKTVSDFENYPRFLYYDEDADLIIADKTS
ncbi:MAG: hypothetical protein K6F64_08640 [Clostridia bacterium]|nr:hypothetical protein [Clostridia bacterium]